MVERLCLSWVACLHALRVRTLPGRTVSVCFNVVNWLWQLMWCLQFSPFFQLKTNHCGKVEFYCRWNKTPQTDSCDAAVSEGTSRTDDQWTAGLCWGTVQELQHSEKVAVQSASEMCNRRAGLFINSHAEQGSRWLIGVILSGHRLWPTFRNNNRLKL